MDRRVLLVEGKDDKHVVRNLCLAHNLPIPFAIEPPKGAEAYSDAGVDHLLDQVPQRLKGPVERLGVMMDADENAETRWVQLRDRLRAAGFPDVPDKPEPGGTILNIDLETRVVRLGVWIMPNNTLPGMLEDFLQLLVPVGDKMLPHVNRFLEAIPKEDRLFSDRLLPKARIHSYLAVQAKPGRPPGQAITFRFLDPLREEAVRPFLNWLRYVLID
jgi:hypothetical protein